jgi:hypothetical protein
MIRTLFIYGVCLFVCSCQLTAQENEPVTKTSFFRFHNNKYVNAHHFLYDLGLNTKAGDNMLDSLQFTYKFTMLPSEREIFMQALAYYKTKVSPKDLSFGRGMIMISQNLMTAGSVKDLQLNIPDTGFTNTFSTVMPLYEKYFWQKHKLINESGIRQVMINLKGIEQPLMKKLGKLLQADWSPKKLNVYFSAYTSTDINDVFITFSSMDPRNSGYHGIEILAHEASHAVVDSLQKMLDRKQVKYNKKIDRQTWHALLFYLPGTLLQQMLASQNISYEIYMQRNRIFMTEVAAYSEALGPYISGKYDMDTAFDKLVSLVKAM